MAEEVMNSSQSTRLAVMAGLLITLTAGSCSADATGQRNVWIVRATIERITSIVRRDAEARVTKLSDEWISIESKHIYPELDKLPQWKDQPKRPTDKNSHSPIYKSVDELLALHKSTPSEGRSNKSANPGESKPTPAKP